MREGLGYVWVCLADELPSFEADVQGAVVERLGDLESIERYGMDDLKLGRRITYDVKANWKLIIENFMECYHCATIHPELIEVLPEFEDGYAAQCYVGDGAEFGEDVQGFTVDGSEGLDRIPGVADDQDRRSYAITVRPQVFIDLVPDHVIFPGMYPLAPDRTVVEGDWLYLPRIVESGKDMDRSVELFHRVDQQDFDACERTQPAMRSKAYAKGGVLVPSAHHIGDFHTGLQNKLDHASITNSRRPTSTPGNWLHAERKTTTHEPSHHRPTHVWSAPTRHRYTLAGKYARSPPSSPPSVDGSSSTDRSAGVGLPSRKQPVSLRDLGIPHCVDESSRRSASGIGGFSAVSDSRCWRLSLMRPDSSCLFPSYGVALPSYVRGASH